jgi:hypothetical protein
MRSIKALILVFFSTLNVLAQSSSFRMVSSDSIPVHMFIGGVQINEQASTDIKTSALSAGKLPLDILTADSTTHLSFSIQLKPGYLHTYELMRIGNEFQLLPLSATVIEQITETNPALQPELAALPSDSIAPDSLPGYSGPIGCRGKCSDSAVDVLVKSMSDMYFEKEKYNAAAGFIRSNCLLTTQVAEILKNIDLEDRKLQLAIMSMDYIYDIGHYLQLSDEFGLTASRTQLEKAFNSRSSPQN